MHRLPLAPLPRGRALLPAASGRYLARVLRARVGDAFEAFDPTRGETSRARIEAIDAGGVTATFDAEVRAAPDAPPLLLVQGYPKGDKLSDIVRDATELGATMILPAICARSIARPSGDRSATRADRLTMIAAEAARQSGRPRAPEVLAPMPFDDALEAAIALTKTAFVLYERADVPLGPDLLAFARDPARVRAGVAVVVGPEGGFEPEEVARAAAHGAHVRSLGATILRTETVAAAVLGALRIVTP